MANSPQARKRILQADKKRLHNRHFRSMMRTAIKTVRTAIQAGVQAAANEAFRQASSLLDRLARKNVIHKKKASRLKSRLNSKIKAMESAS